MDAEDVFFTSEPLDLGLDPEEQQTSLDAHLLRQEAVVSFFQLVKDGLLSPGEINYFGDVLAETDVNPDHYAEAIVDNINFVLANQIPVKVHGLGELRNNHPWI